MSEIAAGDPHDDAGDDARTDRIGGHTTHYRDGRDLDEAAPVLAEEVADGAEGGLPEAAHEAVAAGVGEVERAVADIAVSVPALRRERALRHRICRAEPCQQRVVHSAVHVHEAHRVELLMTGEAAARLAGDGAGGIVAAIGVAAFTPRVVAQALQDDARLVGDDGDRAEVVLVEIPGRDGLVAVLHMHADHAA